MVLKLKEDMFPGAIGGVDWPPNDCIDPKPGGPVGGINIAIV